MLKKIWRYCHLYLAVSTALFMLLATLTGIVLAFEPIQTRLQYAHQENLQDISLAEIIPKTQEHFDEVLDMKRTSDDLIIISGYSLENDIDGEFLLDLTEGAPAGTVEKQTEFFEFVTNLHRSLFLKTTGRWIVGLNSLALFGIAISGLMLIVRRQNGWKNFFRRVIRLDFPSYSHVVLGRWMLIPIAIVAMSAVLLFALRFEFIPFAEDTQRIYEEDLQMETINVSEFPVFQEKTLADFKSLEYPFSEFEEDPYILLLQDKELHIHQYTGQILEEKILSSQSAWYDLNLFLHTGKGSIVWSVILLLTGISILYFMYSGMQMAIPRFKKKASNQFSSQEAEVVVLYGSESGTTQHYATAFYKSLLNVGAKAYLANLNQYRSFPAMKHLVVMTSTHGHGEAPHNADKFLRHLQNNQPQSPAHFSVLGFGSSQYEKFCEYAKVVADRLQNTPNLQEIIEPIYVDHQSEEQVMEWWQNWNRASNIHASIPEKLAPKKAEQHNFRIKSKKVVDDGFVTTFVIILENLSKNLHYQAGDLLGVYPPGDNVARYYSIGTRGNDIVLSVKLHENGKCSQFLFGKQEGESFGAFVKPNSAFHVDKNAPTITYFSNGTGIAPYFGMLESLDSDKNFFYWGGRNLKSWELYQEIFDDNSVAEKHLVFSREQNFEKYLQDLVARDIDKILARLANGGKIMICGSKNMEKDLLAILEKEAESRGSTPIANYIEKGQIQRDTY
ncbi:MAG: PepSY domain-containing protein [Weeksellaceae bacterium]|nr:PepSY domain-containing protein [Weeksellaceae bacterium]